MADEEGYRWIRHGVRGRSLGTRQVRLNKRSDKKQTNPGRRAIINNGSHEKGSTRKKYKTIYEIYTLMSDSSSKLPDRSRLTNETVFTGAHTYSSLLIISCLNSIERDLTIDQWRIKTKRSIFYGRFQVFGVRYADDHCRLDNSFKMVKKIFFLLDLRSLVSMAPDKKIWTQCWVLIYRWTSTTSTATTRPLPLEKD